MKVKKRILISFLSLILCVIAIFTLTNITNQGTKKAAGQNNQTGLEKNVIDYGKHYKVYDVTQNDEAKYTYEIYNESGKIVKKEDVEKNCPKLKYLSEALLSIELNAGTNLCLTQYYDTKTDKFSEIFQTPFAIHDNKVVYMKDSETLIVRDAFDKLKYNKEFRLDFSSSAVPATLITKVKFIDDNELEVTYLSGEDYNEITEILLLD